MDQAVFPMGVALGAGIFQLWRPTTCAALYARAGEPLVYTAYEDALRDAWSTVVARLEDEARRMGAHGVLGTYVSQRWLTDGSSLEIELRGAAVRLENEPPVDRPFLTTLSMQSYLKLLIGGWTPCGIGWGVSAVHVHGNDASPLLSGAALSNMELPVPTAAVALSRARLEAQVRATLASCGAQGGVDMTLTMERRPQGCGGGKGILIDGLMVGTGIVRYGLSLASPSLARDLKKEGRRA